jgi:glycosyltransferase involved in cell wall biosynthesis
MCDGGLSDWKLVFVMSLMDKDKEAFEDFKRKYHNYPITFLINPSNTELWNEYESASLYWHASGFGEDLAKHPDRAEHFGISTVEAMGAGAVPIVVAAGGQKEIINDEHNGRLWSSLEELQKKTLELINDKKQREKLAQQGVIDAGTFSMDRFSEQINELVV